MSLNLLLTFTLALQLELTLSWTLTVASTLALQLECRAGRWSKPSEIPSSPLGPEKAHGPVAQQMANGTRSLGKRFSLGVDPGDLTRPAGWEPRVVGVILP